MDAWKKTGDHWSDIQHQDDLQERVSYDANGNILTYMRNGNTAGGKQLNMDKLVYSYKSGTNQLDHVYDTVPAGNYDVDIDAQAAGNYAYDHIGNLVKDNAEGITKISWTVYGKISRIEKGDSVDILYTYGPDGNRISKTVIKAGATDTARTWYVRDAQGNVMSVYESGKPAVHDGHLTQTELHLYGSSRLGLLRRSVNVDTVYTPADTDMTLLGTGLSVNFDRGNKLFELSNHLGNVLVTVNDKKLGVSSNNSTVDYFNPQVVSAQDYYPFGMLQPGRSYNAGGYRFGFNGKEMDDEVNGEGAQYDYGFRIYDPRVGRFLSVDPLTKSYPWNSPYAFAENDVVRSIDLDGMERKVVIHWVEKIYDDGTPKITKTNVSIDKEDVWRELGPNHNPTGRVYAVTETYYYFFNENRILKGKDLMEEVRPDRPKPSANYDYRKNVMEDKSRDDEAFAGSYLNPLNWEKWYEITDRDLNAPDNATTVEDVSMATLAFSSVIGAPATVRSMLKAEGVAVEGPNAVVTTKKAAGNEYQGMEFLDDNLRMVEQPLEVNTAVTKKSVIEGYRISNHAWRKSGMGRGASEELISKVITNARKAGTVVSEKGTGQFADHVINVYTHDGIKVAVDETKKLILSARPVKGFHLP
jgi:RHS repeat-associated protein